MSNHLMNIYTDKVPNPEEWQDLTVLLEKRKAFSEDVYFRECWADIVDCFGSRAGVALSPFAVLIFKPDAVVGRRMRRTLDYLEYQGFLPVGLRSISLSRHVSGEIWRYNWHFATVDRIWLSTLMYAATETLLLLLFDQQASTKTPGSVHLSELKGSAVAGNRTKHHLREVLETSNRLLNFVHVSDEPADVVRELGILLDRSARQLIFGGLASGSPVANTLVNLRAEVLRAMARLEARYPAHDLDFACSLDRLQSSGALVRMAADEICALATDGIRICWDTLCTLINPQDPRIDLWDFICIAAWVIHDERQGYSDLLPSVGIADWMQAGTANECASSCGPYGVGDTKFRLG